MDPFRSNERDDVTETRLSELERKAEVATAWRKIAYLLIALVGLNVAFAAAAELRAGNGCRDEVRSQRVDASGRAVVECAHPRQRVTVSPYTSYKESFVVECRCQ